MDKEKGKTNGKEKEKERTLDSIMKTKLSVSGMQKGKGKGNAAVTMRLPRKLANDSSNVPIAELLYRLKRNPRLNVSCDHCVFRAIISHLQHILPTHCEHQDCSEKSHGS